MEIFIVILFQGWGVALYLHSLVGFFPITTTLLMILDEQEVVTKELEKREGRIIEWLFHHNVEPLAKHYEKRGHWKIFSSRLE